MNQRIAVDGVTPEHFDELVRLLVSWISDGIVRIRIRRISQVRLDFDESDVLKALETNGLPTSCVGQLRAEIPMMLGGILSGHRGTVTRFIAEHSDGEQTADETTEADVETLVSELNIRTELVESKLVTPELSRLFAIRRTSQNNLFIDASWDIVEKIAVSTGSVPSGLQYATLKITSMDTSNASGRTARDFLPFFVDFENPTVFEALTMTMSAEDIDDLMRILQEASDALGIAASTG